MKLWVRKIKMEGNRANFAARTPDHTATPKAPPESPSGCRTVRRGTAGVGGLGWSGRRVTAPSRNSDTVNGRPATGSEKNKPRQFWVPAFMALSCLHRQEWPSRPRVAWGWGQGPRQGCEHWSLSRLPVRPQTTSWEKGHKE